jgi:hypothetical protein
VSIGMRPLKVSPFHPFKVAGLNLIGGVIVVAKASPF